MAGAIATVAEVGIGASTWAIAKHAGVSEGTVFTYFPTKDDLLNEVYVEIRTSRANAVAAEFPRRASLDKRLRHLWTASLAWAIANASAHRALSQLVVWNGLAEESIKRGDAANPRLFELMRDAKERAYFRDLPDDVLFAVADALQKMTIDLTLRQPKNAKLYRDEIYELMIAGAKRP